MADIEVKAIGKTYGSHKLFDGLDFKVTDGEFMVILGPSGCGKSTLLRIIAGIEPHQQGTVLVGERDVTRETPGAGTSRWCSRTTPSTRT